MNNKKQFKKTFQYFIISRLVFFDNTVEIMNGFINTNIRFAGSRAEEALNSFYTSLAAAGERMFKKKVVQALVIQIMELPNE